MRNPWWTTGYLGLFAVVIAPVAEEFIFRGVLFPFVKQLGWPGWRGLASSLIFAFIHLNAPTFVPLFVLALALTWLYERTNKSARIHHRALFVQRANLGVLFLQISIRRMNEFELIARLTKRCRRTKPS